MGISGLLPLLKEAQEPVHVSKYKDKVVGVDAYVWLHRGAYGCAEALALGKPTQGYINYAMAKVRMLQHHGVTPFLVFDGGHLPAKAKTETNRAQRRSDSIARARELVARGRRKEAREHFTRCIDVTPEMAYQLIKALRAAGVSYIVAAYEADAQLAYLERQGHIDAIITEDSDLLVFGCKTVLYKLDNEGYCMELKHERRHLCRSINLHAFSDDSFRQMAILSGCDYLSSIPGLGLKKSFALLKRHQTVARVLASVRMDGMRIPEGYQDAFARAERTFVYQRVFSRASDGHVQLVTLTEPPSAEVVSDDDDFIGPMMSAEMAAGIANGEINPITRQAIVDLVPSAAIQEQAVPAKAAAPAQTGGFYRQQSRVKRSPPARDAGQRGLDSFFSRSTSNSAASSKSQRRPLLDRTNLGSRSCTSLEPLKMESAITAIQKTPTGRSKYFSVEKNDRTECTDAASGSHETNRIQLATFTPAAHRKQSASPVSSDGGLISSPASASNKRTKDEALRTSPLGCDTVASSPCTSPTLETRGCSTQSAQKWTALPHTDRTILAGCGASAFNEESDMSDAPPVRKNLFDQFRFETPPAKNRMRGSVSTGRGAWPSDAFSSRLVSKEEKQNSNGQKQKRILQVEERTGTAAPSGPGDAAIEDVDPFGASRFKLQNDSTTMPDARKSTPTQPLGASPFGGHDRSRQTPKRPAHEDGLRRSGSIRRLRLL